MFFVEFFLTFQGWKLLTVCLSGTGKNSGGQVNILGTFPKERLKFLPVFTSCYTSQSRGQAKVTVVR